MALLSFTCFIFRYHIGKFFTDDTDILSIIGDLFVLVFPFQILDSIQGATAGALRAMGKQSLIAYINFIFIWALGMPLMYYFGFYLKLELFGIWVGFIVSMILVSFSFLGLLFNIDWGKESEKALKNY